MRFICFIIVYMIFMRCIVPSIGFQVLRPPPKGKSIRFGRQERLYQSRLFALTDSTNTGSLHETISNIVQEEDVDYMNLAITYARHGFGHTFPNPAVGCVLVVRNDDSNEIIGSGFHPRAGMPHAEVFALLEACGYLEKSGVDAAMCFTTPQQQNNNRNSTSSLTNVVLNLTSVYTTSEHGASQLFQDKFKDMNVTAYVTLEPCCHYGKTPPCAASFTMAGVQRVVVGFRDPNPRVDGGGVQLLRDAGVDVSFIADTSIEVANDCAELVENFVKRITHSVDSYSHVNGAKRRALRSLCAKRRQEGTLRQVDWEGQSVDLNSVDDLEIAVDQLQLDPTWMEFVDAELWDTELVQLKLNKAVAKKKGTKRLGERIASELNAHLAQILGHTILLYRPAIPPILDLDELVKNN